jgi:UDP-N-acetyl-D-galactosamine dehydrogenase
MLKKDIRINGANILILGFTFKEDCPDVRNTKVIDIMNELNTYSVNLTLVDPWADSQEINHEYGIQSYKETPLNQKFDAVILAVGHKIFLELDLRVLLKPLHVVYDVKGVLPKELVDGGL